MSKWIVLTLIAVGCVLLAVGNGALWLELNVFNADRFGDHVVQGLQSPAASDALAEKVVDVLMAEMPDLPPLARLPAREVVSWSLQRPLFAGPFQETAALALNAMTTSTEDVVGIDLADKLSTLGATVAGAIAVVAPESGEAAQDAISAAIESSQVSGRLAVYESGRFPKLRTLSSIAPWAALLSLVAAIVLFYIATNRSADPHEAVAYSALGVMITAVLGILIVVPLVRSSVENGVVDPNMQVVAGEIASVFVRTYAVQSLILFTIGVAVLVINSLRGTDQEQAIAA